MLRHAFEMTKALLRAAVDAPWEQALKLEEYAEANCLSTASLPEAAREIQAASRQGSSLNRERCPRPGRGVGAGDILIA
jgi:hypothetical protein